MPEQADQQKLQEESEAARKAAEAEASKRRANAMDILDKINAVEAAKALMGEFKEENEEKKLSPLRQFMKRVAEEAENPGTHIAARGAVEMAKQGLPPLSPITPNRSDGKEPWEDFKKSRRCPKEEYSSEFTTLMGEMVKYEIEQQQEQERLAKEKKKEKEKADEIKAKEENETKLKQSKEALRRDEAYREAFKASRAVAAATSVVVSPLQWLTGFAEFLKKNSNDADSWDLLIKIFEAFATLVKLPLDLVKSGIDSIALKNATPGQRTAYNKYMSDSTGKSGTDLKKLNDETKDKTRSDYAEAARKAYEDANIATNGDIDDGVYGEPEGRSR